MQKSDTESTPASQRLKELAPVIERFVAQATTATRGPLLRALAQAEIGTAKGLSKAATQLQSAARRLETSGRMLASRQGKPRENGRPSGDDNDLGEEICSPHLA